MPDISLRRIPRDKLFTVFKTPELVRLVEDILAAVTAGLNDADSVATGLAEHIADTIGAHQAGAIGNTPAGSISATTVQGAIDELEAEKVSSNAPDITNAKLLAVVYSQQDAPISKAAAATLTAGELLIGLVQYTGAAAALTLPLGSDMDAGALAGLAVDRAFEFAIVNTGAGAATLTAAAGFTIVGAAALASGTSGRFRCRRTATNTWVAYRIG